MPRKPEPAAEAEDVEKLPPTPEPPMPPFVTTRISPEYEERRLRAVAINERRAAGEDVAPYADGDPGDEDDGGAMTDDGRPGDEDRDQERDGA